MEEAQGESAGDGGAAVTPKLELLDHQTIVVSPTQLETMKTCPRMWHYRQMWRRVRAAADGARDGGKAFDAALNRRYTQAGNGPVTPDLEAEMLADIDAGFAGLDLPLDEYRTAVRYKEVVRAYNERYGQENFEVLSVQMPFTVPLGEVPVSAKFWLTYMEDKHGLDCDLNKMPGHVQVLLHGILDLLVRRDDGLTLIVDTKTANQWNAQRQAEYDNHGQMKAYAWAVPRIRAQAEALGVSDPALVRLPEVVHGCMPNVVVIRKPYAREGSASKPNALARNEFHRLVTTYTPERLEEWRVDALAYIEQTFRYVASGHWPQNEKHCSHHYGKKCSYCDVCFVPKVQRQIVLESDLYMDYARGPLAEVKEEKVEVV
jgi:hypothetical protein